MFFPKIGRIGISYLFCAKGEKQNKCNYVWIKENLLLLYFFLFIKQRELMFFGIIFYAIYFVNF